MRFSTELLLDGLRVEAPPRDVMRTKAYRQANAIYCPLGPAPTRAWLFIRRETLDELDINAAHTITWKYDEASGDAGTITTSRTLEFPGLYVVRSSRVYQGGVGDDNSLFVIELADGRFNAIRSGDTGALTANLRSFASPADYLSDATGVTWESYVGSLWSAVGALGSFPGLPTLDLTDGPEGNWHLGMDPYVALNAVLDYLDCAIQPDPYSTNFSIVQLGDSQSTSTTSALKYDGEPTTPIVTRVAGTIRVYNRYHRKGYGQERDTEVDSNWMTNRVARASDRETGVTNASGIRVLWDDLPAIINEAGQLENETDLNTEADRRVARYKTRMAVTRKHCILAGLHASYVPGGQIRAILWRNWGDHTLSDVGGTVTEFVCDSELMGDLHGGEFSLLGSQSPERESYLPPDLARATFPNYPRTANLVQVLNTTPGAVSGNIVMPDKDSSGVQVHSGAVRRWVDGDMPVLEDCWILFTDQFDTKRGNVVATQNDVYGPARLCGVMTCSSETRPVYVVRSGGFIQHEELCVFELTNTLDMQGEATAVICELNAGVYVATTTSITVADFFRTFGEWQGEIGYRGTARKRTDNKYDILWMERPALLNEVTLTTDVAGSSANISTTYSYQQGDKTPPVITSLSDPSSFFPKALKNAKALAVWNDRREQLEPIVCQQQTFYAYASLNQIMMPQESGPIAITGFTVAMFSPFNVRPQVPPTTAQNSLHLWGEPNDLVLLIYDDSTSKWEIIQANRQDASVECVKVTSYTQSTDGYLCQADTIIGGLRGFRGRVMRTDFRVDPGKLIETRECLIIFNDYGDSDALTRDIVAENGKIYGPAKWMGLKDGFPIYFTSVGPQVWESSATSSYAKGDTDKNFTLYNYDGSASGVVLPADVPYNAYSANKKAITQRLNRRIVSNQIECG